MRRLATVAALALAPLLAPEAAQACAVCTNKDSAAVSWAMLKGTALLSLLPLVILGTGAWYLRRRARQIAAAEAAAEAAQPPRAVPTATRAG